MSVERKQQQHHRDIEAWLGSLIQPRPNNMAKWFRSAEMEYVSLIVNEDAAHAAINDLGMLGIIQFTDVSV